MDPHSRSATRVSGRPARWAVIAATTGLTLLLTAGPALAHEGPDEGAEWLMADWMLLAWLVFFGAALVGALVAVKCGWLRNPEGLAKHYLLEIDEPDYYTPDWAREPDLTLDLEPDGRAAGGAGGGP